MKRSKSDQSARKLPAIAAIDRPSPESGTASAPERIEGNEDDDDMSEDTGSPSSSILEDAMDEAEDRPYFAAGNRVQYMQG